MQQAMRISDETLFLHKGRLIEFDKTEKIFQNPTQEKTKAYIEGKFG